MINSVQCSCIKTKFRERKTKRKEKETKKKCQNKNQNLVSIIQTTNAINFMYAKTMRGQWTKFELEIINELHGEQWRPPVCNGMLFYLLINISMVRWRIEIICFQTVVSALSVQCKIKGTGYVGEIRVIIVVYISVESKPLKC